jgi:hypothetical protein
MIFFGLRILEIKINKKIGFLVLQEKILKTKHVFFPPVKNFIKKSFEKNLSYFETF